MGGSRRGEGRKAHKKKGMTRGNASTRIKTRRAVKRNTGGATRGGSHRGKKRRKPVKKKRRTLKRIPRKRKKT